MTTRPPLNEIPKVVFSRTLTEATWPVSAIAPECLSDEIAKLKRQPGGRSSHGGAEFAQALSRAGLVEEYSIVVQPVAYGGGKRIACDLPDRPAPETSSYDDLSDWGDAQYL